MLLDDLKAARKMYGPTMTDDECVALINAVAWKWRGEGWGLNAKDQGKLGTRYDGRKLAHDVLHHKPTNRMYDVLIAAGAASSPTWGDLGINQNEQRPWVAPIEPRAGTIPVDPPKPEPTPKKEYPGDGPWWSIGTVLSADYVEAGRPGLDAGSGVWFGRVVWDHLNEGLSLEASIQKHRPEWRAALGLP